MNTFLMVISNNGHKIQRFGHCDNFVKCVSVVSSCLPRSKASYCARGHWFPHPLKIVLFHNIPEISQISKSNTRHVCTYINAFLMVIPNIFTKFQNLDIFEHFVTFLDCRLLVPAA